MTEKSYNPNQKENKAMQKQPKQALPKVVEPKLKQEVVEEKINETSPTEEAQKVDEHETHDHSKNTEEKKTKGEKAEGKKPAKKIKKEEVYVNAKSVPVSTKYAVSICKFIKGKRIGDAIRDLDQVVLLKKVVPMTGEYSHQKGKGISGGAFPQRASKHFIVLLKSLAGNANNHEIVEPFIFEASANWAQAPKGRFGRVRRKRTHITLGAKEMKIKENKKKEKKK
jgi:ribosomal protein L22